MDQTNKELAAPESVTVIDLSTNIYSPSLFARILWEKLFRMEKAHEWRSLDNFLIDLKDFEKFSETETNFYWGFHKCGNTNVNTEEYLIMASYDDYYFVEYFYDQKQLKREIRLTKKCSQ